jgi:hypothetical protein
MSRPASLPASQASGLAGTNLTPSLQTLLQKQQEHAGLQALREASAELLARVEKLAEMSNVMADGGEGGSGRVGSGVIFQQSRSMLMGPSDRRRPQKLATRLLHTQPLRCVQYPRKSDRGLCCADVSGRTTRRADFTRRHPSSSGGRRAGRAAPPARPTSLQRRDRGQCEAITMASCTAQSYSATASATAREGTKVSVRHGTV